MSEDVVFELAPLSVQFFVNLQPWIAELDPDGLSVQDGDLLHKFAGDGVIVCGEFRFPPLNKFPQAVHPGRLASLPLIRLLERPKLVQDALPLLRDFSEPGVQFFVFRILRQRQRLFHQHRLFRRQGRQPLPQGEGINPAALLSLLDKAGDVQELLRNLLPGLVEAVDGLQDGPVQLIFIQRGGVVAEFRAELQPGDTAPDNALLAAIPFRPPFVGRASIA